MSKRLARKIVRQSKELLKDKSVVIAHVAIVRKGKKLKLVGVYAGA